MTKGKRIARIILLVMVSCVFAAVIILSMTNVVCENETEIWALPPRKTIDNVMLSFARSDEKYQLLGTFTDVKGGEWYVVAGVSKQHKEAGQSIGFIKQVDSRLSFGW